MNKKRLGIVLAVSSAVVFGIMPLMTKLLYQMGGNPVSIPFYRNFFISILLGFVVVAKRQPLKLSGKTYLLLFVASFFGLYITTMFLYLSYYSIPSGMATTIHFSYPILVSVGSIFLVRRRNQLLKYLALLISAIGMALLFEISAAVDWHGIVLSLISAITYAIYILLIEHSSLRTANPLVVAFYLNIFTTLTFGVHGMISGQISISYAPQTWLMMVGFALLIGIGGSFFIQLAIGYIGGQSAAIISTFEPITSIVIGILLLNEALTTKMTIGMTLIIVAALMVIIIEGGSSEANSVKNQLDN